MRLNVDDHYKRIGVIPVIPYKNYLRSKRCQSSGSSRSMQVEPIPEHAVPRTSSWVELLGPPRTTPGKTKEMSPENQWLEDVFPIEIVPFLGDMLVFGGVSLEEQVEVGYC